MEKGFSYRKGRSTKTDNTEDATKRTFLCKHAGTNNTTKTTTLNEQRNRSLCRVNCLWRVNISKKGDKTYIVITFINEHAIALSLTADTYTNKHQEIRYE